MKVTAVVLAFCLMAVAAYGAAPAEEEDATRPVDVLDTMSNDIQDQNRQSIKLAAANALKFQQAGAEAAAASNTANMKAMEAATKDAAKAKPELNTFKVSPTAKEGVEVKPAPGQNDPAVRVRAQDDFMGPVTQTTDYIGSHSYQEDIKALLSEIDESENKVKGLKLRIVEKENFVDSLVKREDLLQQDLKSDKTAVEDLHSHVKALKARVERLKKEKQLRMLESQFHEYSAAASKLKTQADELASVKSALYSKMRALHNAITPLRAAETTNMRQSIDAGKEDKNQQQNQDSMADENQEEEANGNDMNQPLPDAGAGAGASGPQAGATPEAGAAAGAGSSASAADATDAGAASADATAAGAL